MSDIPRYRMAVYRTRDVSHHLCIAGGYWCKFSDHEAERKADRDRIKELEGWEDVVRKCEDLFQCPDGHAENPSMSNLPNIIRDTKSRIKELATENARYKKALKSITLKEGTVRG